MQRLGNKRGRHDVSVTELHKENVELNGLLQAKLRTSGAWEEKIGSNRNEP
jgi:hypothetical protein